LLKKDKEAGVIEKSLKKRWEKWSKQKREQREFKVYSGRKPT